MNDTAPAADNQTPVDEAQKKPRPWEKAKELLERLTQAYPAAFRPLGERISPLKLGIHKELAPVVQEWGYDQQVLKCAMSLYTRHLRYQTALAKATHRIDLNGETAEEITEEHREKAREQVNTIQEKRRASRKAREGEAAPVAEGQAAGEAGGETPAAGERPRRPRPARPPRQEGQARRQDDQPRRSGPRRPPRPQGARPRPTAHSRPRPGQPASPEAAPEREDNRPPVRRELNQDTIAALQEKLSSKART